MEKKLLLLLLAVCCLPFMAISQIQVSTTSDFEDGTTQGWSNGNSSPNPPTNIPTGGPTGAGDNFLEEISSGGVGAGSKLVIQNTTSKWTGDYTNAGVFQLSFLAKNPGANDLTLRVAMEGGPGSSRIASSNAISLPTTQTEWDIFFIPITANDFTVVGGPNTVQEVLSNVTQIRIISNENIDYNGQALEGTLHIDNITADGVAGIADARQFSVEIYPNPTYKDLFLTANRPVENFQIYSALGNVVSSGQVGSDNVIPTVNLSAGVYFVKLTSNKASTVLKFIKY
ncbi:MAG: hypothetical protein CMC08_04225 [Flavobacteriaceae bacterium]|nr:hypothetical protein [Flavobacteriaceae bacterium]